MSARVALSEAGELHSSEGELARATEAKEVIVIFVLTFIGALLRVERARTVVRRGRGHCLEWLAAVQLCFSKT